MRARIGHALAKARKSSRRSGLQAIIPHAPPRPFPRHGVGAAHRLRNEFPRHAFPLLGAGAHGRPRRSGGFLPLLLILRCSAALAVIRRRLPRVGCAGMEPDCARRGAERPHLNAPGTSVAETARNHPQESNMNNMSRIASAAAGCALAIGALAGCAGMYEPVNEQPMTVAPRGDNPNLPNPVTPRAANESAAQPQGSLRDPTNSSGMGGSAR